MTDTTDLAIGFIGTGVMGRSMAAHLLDAGHTLHVYNRTKSKAADLLDRGATWQDTPSAVAEHCNVIFTIVSFPRDVEEVYFGKDGILQAMQPGTIVVDMTTSRPDLAERIAEQAHQRNGMALDAPVSGGDTGARQGTLSIMIGGDREAYDRVLPLLEHMGGNIVYQGGPGSGQHCKMCNQIAIASNMMGVCEAVAYARQAGLEPETVLKSISAGAAGSWSLSNLAPRILKGNFDPGFYVKHFIKDMVIASRSADGMGLPTPGLDVAKNLYQQLAANGHGDEGTQALYRFYDGEG
ncbi:MAG: NAD(P)-dependent oxidoreductase [Phycisphaerae bacterium]